MLFQDSCGRHLIQEHGAFQLRRSLFYHKFGGLKDFLKDLAASYVLQCGSAIYPKDEGTDFVVVALLPNPLGSSAFCFWNMKILLRNKSTGYFYAGGNQWTPEVGAAHDFQTGLNALQYSNKSPSEGVEFVYLQTETTEDFILPKVSVFQRAQI
jgi:hypothetical protein